MLAKNVNDDTGILIKRGVCGFFVSKLAPTTPLACFGAMMKNAYVPLAWFVILGSMLAAASSLSLVLV